MTIHANLDLDEKINFEDKTLEKSILNEAEKHTGAKIIKYQSHFGVTANPKQPINRDVSSVTKKPLCRLFLLPAMQWVVQE